MSETKDDIQKFLDMLNEPEELPPEPELNVFNRKIKQDEAGWKKDYSEMDGKSALAKKKKKAKVKK